MTGPVFVTVWHANTKEIKEFSFPSTQTVERAASSAARAFGLPGYPWTFSRAPRDGDNADEVAVILNHGDRLFQVLQHGDQLELVVVGGSV